MLEQQKRVKYPYAGKESLGDIIYKSFPRQLRPTKKTNTYIGIIFFVVLVIALIQFPYNPLITGNTNVTINIGYPLHFLKFNLNKIKTNPLQIGGLILDLILYIFIAYLVDVTTNLILKNPSLISKKDSKKQPKIFKDKKTGTAAEKVAEKTSPPIPNKINNPQTPPINNPQSQKQPSTKNPSSQKQTLS